MCKQQHNRIVEFEAKVKELEEARDSLMIELDTLKGDYGQMKIGFKVAEGSYKATSKCLYKIQAILMETFDRCGKLEAELKTLQFECDGKNICLERVGQLLREATKVIHPKKTQVDPDFGEVVDNE